MAFGFVQGEVERAHGVGDRPGVEFADAVVLRQAALRREAHAGADGHPIADAGDGTGAAEVAGYDAERRAGHRLRAILIEAAGNGRDVLAAAQLGGALGDELVAGPVEAVAPDANVPPALGNRVSGRRR